MRKSAKRSPKKVTRPAKAQSVAPLPPSPLAVAKTEVDNYIHSAGDWHGDLVWQFMEGCEPTIGQSALDRITAAAKAHRLADSGDDRDPHAAALDDVHAAFSLGFALGSRFGGAR